jgi:hypothetical protein
MLYSLVYPEDSCRTLVQDVHNDLADFTSSHRKREKSSETFIVVIITRPVLGFTQTSFQWVSGALSPGIKQLERECEELYLNSLIRFHGVVLINHICNFIVPY